MHGSVIGQEPPTMNAHEVNEYEQTILQIKRNIKMKKQLLQLTLPLITGLVGMNVAFASEAPANTPADYEALSRASYNFDNETDFMAGDGYWVFHPRDCGVVLTPLRINGHVIEKYRLGNDLRCQSVNQQDAAITLYGDDVVLDLNQKTVDCQRFSENEFVDVGISMQGLRGKLKGYSHHDDGDEVQLNDDDLALINNCFIGVQIGPNQDFFTPVPPAGPRTSAELQAFPNRTGENSVTRIQTTLCAMGLNVTNNDNHIHHNLFHCGSFDNGAISEKSLDEPRPVIEFGAGLSLAGTSCGENACAAMAQGDPGVKGFEDPNIYRNIVEYNLAYANDAGFVAGNSDGIIVNRKDANILRHNVALSNYGDGYFIDGPNVILERNLSTNNEGSGFNYHFDLIIPGGELEFNTPYVIFEKNRAYFNLENGFGAGELCTGSPCTPPFYTNGAEFIENTAFFNASSSSSTQEFYDLFDSNVGKFSSNYCSTSFYDLDKKNAWVRNKAGTVKPECTRGGA